MKVLETAVSTLRSRSGGLVWLLLAALWAGGVSAQGGAGVAGRVISGQDPLDAVKVYAYETGNFSFRRVLTDAAGRFLFEALPAGVYQIVAFKDGFQPIVREVERRSDGLLQRLELRLVPTSDDDPRAAEGYWAMRRRIPPDVLRDATGYVGSAIAADAAPIEVLVGPEAGFEARLGAEGGVANYGGGSRTQMASADLGVRGEVGGVRLGVEGRFQRLAGAGQNIQSSDAESHAHAVAVEVEAPASSDLRLLSASAEMPRGGRQGVDLQHHQLRWSGKTGAKARSGFSARLLEESNYYRPDWVGTATDPSSSRTLDLEGFYSREVTGGLSFEAGLHYRDREGSGSTTFGGLPEESYGVYGQAAAQLLPRVMVEIGVFSKYRDGSLSLMPQGAFIIDLGEDWRARATVAKRVEEERETTTISGFTASTLGDSRACREAGEACYAVSFEHGHADRPNFTIGAIHREYAETLQVYFSDDFFGRLESLFMVQGDVLPEVQVSMVRQITPKILARLESNYASGGGGIFYATDNRSYENRIRYLVTSLDTTFQQTSTGVFVAFHHLEQSLLPTDTTPKAGNELEMQRLQVMLTQDLDALMNISTNWAVRLNMELSRGATPYRLTTDDEMYKSLTGGFSVSF